MNGCACGYPHLEPAEPDCSLRGGASQERARFTAKQESRIERTGQTELFAAASVPGGPPSFDEERAMQQGAARQRLRGLLQANRVVPYDQALAALLEIPLVWDSDVIGGGSSSTTEAGRRSWPGSTE